MIKHYNHEKNKILFDKYGTLRWSLDTDIDFPDEGKFEMCWKGNFIDNDIEIIVKVNGEEVKLKNNKESMKFEVVV